MSASDKVISIRSGTLNNHYGLNQLLQLNEPEIEPLIPGLFDRGTTVVIAGKPKAGKSLLLGQATLALSTGGIFLGSQIPVPSRVLYCDIENGPARSKVRFSRQTAAMPHILSNVDVYTPRRLATNEIKCTTTGIEILQQHLKCNHSNVLIIDPWRLFLNGANENEAREVAKALEMLSDIRKDNPALTVIIVHHVRKTVGDKNPVRLRSDPEQWVETISGSQALIGHADVILGLEKETFTEGGGDQVLVLGGVSRDGVIQPRFLKLDSETLIFTPIDDAVSMKARMTPAEYETFKVLSAQPGWFTVKAMKEERRLHPRAISGVLKTTAAHLFEFEGNGPNKRYRLITGTLGTEATNQ